MNIIWPLSISESWTKLFHHTVQSCFQTFWETQDWWRCSYLRIWNHRGRLLFRLQRRKKTQADVSFRFVSALILPFTNVMMQLSTKLLAWEVLLSCWRTTAEAAAAAIFPQYADNLSKALAHNLWYIILSKNFDVYKTIRYLSTLLWQILSASTKFCYSSGRASRSFWSLRSKFFTLEDHVQWVALSRNKIKPKIILVNSG